MKRRIDQFLKTYFYFNRQERKGLISLLAVILLFQLGSYLFKRFDSVAALQVQNIPLEQIGQLEKMGSSFESDKEQIEPKYAERKSYYPIYHRTQRSNSKHRDTIYPKYIPKKYSIVELNLADSAQLVSLPKIGPVLAGRIVQYRTKLGGFRSLDQLKEIWGFQEDFLFDLHGKISLNPDLHQMVNINEVDLNTLRAHPYFKYTLSGAIVNYRKQHGKFKSPEDLKKIKIVTDSIYNLIKDYVSISP